MIRTGFLRRRIALLLAVAIILAAGGVAVASNMGFKLNRILVIDPDANSVNNVGKNYVSIPFYNPYPTWADACAAWGLPPFRPSPLPARRGAVATKHIVNPQFPPQGADD